MKTLTDAQRRCLDTIRRNFDPEEGYVVSFGAHGDCRDYRTLNALEGKGYVKIERRSWRVSELRKGYFGRFVGGTRRRLVTEFRVVELCDPAPPCSRT